eukprot:Gb_22333 [translate_table: standard]
MRWLLDSHLYKEVRKFVKDVFMENNIEIVFQCQNSRQGNLWNWYIQIYVDR